MKLKHFLVIFFICTIILYSIQAFIAYDIYWVKEFWETPEQRALFCYSMIGYLILSYLVYGLIYLTDSDFGKFIW